MMNEIDYQKLIDYEKQMPAFQAKNLQMIVMACYLNDVLKRSFKKCSLEFGEGFALMCQEPEECLKLKLSQN
jgi:hypothetical protein